MSKDLKRAEEAREENIKMKALRRKEEEELERMKLEWVQLQKDLKTDEDGKPFVDTNKKKFIRVFSQNPMIPIGKVYSPLTY